MYSATRHHAKQLTTTCSLLWHFNASALTVLLRSQQKWVYSIPPSHAQCSLRIIADKAVLDEQLRELNNTLKTFMQDMTHEAVPRNDESLIKCEVGSISV